MPPAPRKLAAGPCTGATGGKCERHHTKVHHGFRVERDDTAPPGHRWRTYRPDDTEIIIGPRWP